MSISLVNFCYNITGNRMMPSYQWLVFYFKKSQCLNYYLEV